MSRNFDNYSELDLFERFRDEFALHEGLSGVPDDFLARIELLSKFVSSEKFISPVKVMIQFYDKTKKDSLKERYIRATSNNNLPMAQSCINMLKSLIGSDSNENSVSHKNDRSDLCASSIAELANNSNVKEKPTFRAKKIAVLASSSSESNDSPQVPNILEKPLLGKRNESSKDIQNNHLHAKETFKEFQKICSQQSEKNDSDSEDSEILFQPISKRLKKDENEPLSNKVESGSRKYSESYGSSSSDEEEIRSKRAKKPIHKKLSKRKEENKVKSASDDDRNVALHRKNLKEKDVSVKSKGKQNHGKDRSKNLESVSPPRNMRKNNAGVTSNESSIVNCTKANKKENSNSLKDASIKPNKPSGKQTKKRKNVVSSDSKKLLNPEPRSKSSDPTQVRKVKSLKKYNSDLNLSSRHEKSNKSPKEVKDSKNIKSKTKNKTETKNSKKKIPEAPKQTNKKTSDNKSVKDTSIKGKVVNADKLESDADVSTSKFMSRMKQLESDILKGVPDPLGSQQQSSENADKNISLKKKSGAVKNKKNTRVNKKIKKETPKQKKKVNSKVKSEGFKMKTKSEKSVKKKIPTKSSSTQDCKNDVKSAKVTTNIEENNEMKETNKNDNENSDTNNIAIDKSDNNPFVDSEEDSVFNAELELGNFNACMNSIKRKMPQLNCIATPPLRIFVNSDNCDALTDVLSDDSSFANVPLKLDDKNVVKRMAKANKPKNISSQVAKSIKKLVKTPEDLRKIMKIQDREDSESEIECSSFSEEN